MWLANSREAFSFLVYIVAAGMALDASVKMFLVGV